MIYRCKEKPSVKTKPLNKRLLSTVVVCCRLLSDIFLITSNIKIRADNCQPLLYILNPKLFLGFISRILENVLQILSLHKLLEIEILMGEGIGADDVQTEELAET